MHTESENKGVYDVNESMQTSSSVARGGPIFGEKLKTTPPQRKLGAEVVK